MSAVAGATSDFDVVEAKLLEKLHAEMFKAGRGKTLQFCEQTGLRLVAASVREVPERQVDHLLSCGLRGWSANGWPPRSCQSCPPGLGQRQPTCRAMKQLDPEPPFERCHVLGCHRLRHPERAGGSRRRMLGQVGDRPPPAD